MSNYVIGWRTGESLFTSGVPEMEPRIYLTLECLAAVVLERETVLMQEREAALALQQSSPTKFMVLRAMQLDTDGTPTMANTMEIRGADEIRLQQILKEMRAERAPAPTPPAAKAGAVSITCMHNPRLSPP